MLKKVLFKMPTLPLCRLRQTCSGLNILIEENKIKFSARSALGVEICLFLNKYPMKIFDCKSTCRLCVDSEFENKMSAISIRTLKINIKHSDSLVREKAIQKIRGMNLICEIFYPSYLPIDFLVNVLNSINCRKEVNFYGRDDVFLQYLPPLRMDLYRDNTSDFDHWFDLYFGTYHKPSYFDTIKFASPPLNVFWKAKYIPLISHNYPTIIRLIEKNRRYIVLTQEHTLTYTAIRIRLCKKNPEALWDTIMEMFHITQNDNDVAREKFRLADKRRKREILREYLCSQGFN